MMHRVLRIFIHKIIVMPRSNVTLEYARMPLNSCFVKATTRGPNRYPDMPIDIPNYLKTPCYSLRSQSGGPKHNNLPRLVALTGLPTHTAGIAALNVVVHITETSVPWHMTI